MGVNTMKMKILLFSAILTISGILYGCGKETADQYAGEQITKWKSEDPSVFSSLLEEGIKVSNASYVLDFPEELKEPYTELMQTAFSSIDFKVESASERVEDVYAVKITFTPVSFEQTLQETNNSLLSNPESADFSESLSGLIGQDIKQLESNAVYEEETTFELMVSKSEDGFSIHENHFLDFMISCMNDYMVPYNSCCELYEAQDFLKANLDASFKGDVDQFALHMGLSEEEALAWYETDVFNPPEGFSSAYADRYRKALQSIMKQCRYTVGIPRKEAEPYHYQIEVSVVPNTSLTDAFEEYSSKTYPSTEKASAALTEILEKYAASPSYGDETLITVSLNEETLSDTDSAESEMAQLWDTILPPA